MWEVCASQSKSFRVLVTPFTFSTKYEILFFTGLGFTERSSIDEIGITSLKNDILGLLGMKEVPSTVTSPHFLPHDGLEPSTISKFMLNLHQSLTEEQSAVLKSNLSEDDLNRLRNNPFHIVDSEIAAIQAQ